MAETDKLDVDDADIRIMRALSTNARAADVAIAEDVNLSAAAVARRRRVLEERGYIRGYYVDFDMEKLGYHMIAIVHIELSSQSNVHLNDFEKAVVECPSMTFCSFVSGDTDFLMMLNVRSFDDYDRIYRSELASLPFVARIRSSFVMREVSRRPLPPCLFT